MEMQRVLNIPARSAWSSLGLVILVGLTYLWFREYIPELSTFFTKEPEMINPSHTVQILAGLIISTLLIVGNVCLAVNIFKPLKSWRRDGLFQGLTLALIGGIILVFSIGTIVGIPISGLIMGIIGALIAGLIGGLVKEFN